MKKEKKGKKERKGICTAVLLAVARLLQQHLLTAPRNSVETLECVGCVEPSGKGLHCFCPSLSHTLFIVLLFGIVCPGLCAGHGLLSLCLCVIGILFIEEQVHNLPRTVYVYLLL